MKSKQYIYKKVLAWILSLGLTTQTYVWAAQTVAIPDAQQDHHAMVSESANGVTVVDIRRPNVQGLSHNQFTNLQVGNKGIIFNNSNKIVDTKLAGLIKNNPALAGTRATTILNEVTGTNPTAIQGAMEIAGPKANLIIANPNGLYINNGSFINTNRAVLTTGMPIIRNGTVTEMVVRGGTVEIAGQGLDAKMTSATDILAQATKINAGVWADSLRVVTGNNSVSLTSDAVKKDGEHFEVGLDVSAIGGMYANRIVLVGTEKGLGVNLDGRLTALNGTVTMTTDGHVAMTGTMSGTDGVSLKADFVDVNSTGNLNGRAVTVQANTVRNEGQVYSTEGPTNISATTVDNTNGHISSNNDVTITAQAVTNTKGDITAQGTVQVTAPTVITDKGTIAANKNVTVEATNVQGNSATISAGENVALNTHTLTGDNKTIEAGQNVTIRTQSDTAFNGDRVAANDGVTIETTGQVTNNTKLESGKKLTVKANGLTNTGTLTASDVTVNMAKGIENTGLINGQTTSLTANFIQNEQQGRIYGDTVSLQANSIKNIGTYEGDAPVIAARQNMNIGVGTLTNTEHALIKAENNLSIGRQVNADNTVSGSADSLQNSSATIEGGNDVQIITKALKNENLHYSTKKAEIGREHHLEVAVEGLGGHIAVDSLPYYGDNQEAPSEGIAVVNRENDQLYFANGHPDAPDKKYFETWYKYDYERTIIADVVDTTDPGRIISGANMNVFGSSVVNDKSEVIAGGTVTIHGGEIQNINPVGEKIYQDSGDQYRYSRHKRKGHDTTNKDRSDYSHTESHEHIVPMTNYGSHKTSSVITPMVSAYTLPDGTEAMKVSKSALYNVSPDVTANYYIETDPTYTNRHNFLSSDYFLHLLQSDPNRTAKRLGDGYYEAELVKDQIFNLTGRRYLGDVASDEAQYKELMDNAATFAQTSHATIGVALTAEQQAQLKENIVWMEETSVVLPNGKVVTALVPKVYLAKAAQEEQMPHVAVISGRNVDIQATKNILNSGTIVAGNVGVLKARNIENVQGTIKANSLGLTAADSVHNLGGTLEAVKALSVTASKDIMITSTTKSIVEKDHTATYIDSVGKVKVSGNGATLSLSAGRDVTLKGALIENKGDTGKTVINATRDVRIDTVSTASTNSWDIDSRNSRHESQTAEVGSVIAGKGDIVIGAGRDITAKAATIASSNNVELGAGRNVSITSGVATTGLQESYYLVGKTGGGNRQVNSGHNEEYTTTQIRSTLSGKNVTIKSGSNLTASGTTITAGDAVTLAAHNNVEISGVTNERKAFGTAYEYKGGLLSKETTNSSYRTDTQKVQKSQVSGQTVTIESGSNVQANASDIVGKGDTAVRANGNVTLGTMTESASQESYSQTKKSGFSLSGIGISYGKERLKSTQTEVQTTPVGSTVGSVTGNTSIEANKDVHATTATIAGKQGVIIKGQEVTLDGTYATYEAHNAIDYKKSGLTISLGGAVPQALSTAASYVRQGNGREDKRLTALEYGEAGRELKKGLDAVKSYQAYTPEALTTYYSGIKQQGEVLVRSGETAENSIYWIDRQVGKAQTEIGNAKIAEANKKLDLANDKEQFKKEKDKRRDALVNIHIGIGSQSANQSSDIREAVYKSGVVASEAGNIVIVAHSDNPNKGTVTAVGQTIQGKATKLVADNDVKLLAAENTTHIEENSKSKGWSAGVSVGLSGFVGADIGANKSREAGLTDAVTHTGTSVVGADTATIQAGNNVDIIGSNVTGNRVDVTAGHDLTITSLQDSEHYKNDRQSAGFSLSFDGKGISNASASADKGTTRSSYASVTNQSGIYGGSDGVSVDVNGKTTLTGAVIDSKATPNKNSMITGTLEMKDIINKAAYSDKSIGIGYFYNRDYEDAKKKVTDIQNWIATRDKRLGIQSGENPLNYLTTEERATLDQNYNKMGLVPDLSTGTHGEAISVTKSAIAKGSLNVTNEAIDIQQVNRQTENTLNTLGKIFNKKKVEEKQELAKLFARNANEAIHIISEKKGWKDGSPEKITLHSFFAGIEGELSGNGFTSGALSGGVNEAAVEKFIKALGTNNPDLVQAASAILGYATNKAIGEDELAGAALAQWGTKWNGLDWYQQSTFGSDSFLSYLKRDIYRGKINGIIEDIKSGILISLEHPELDDIAMREMIDTLNQAAVVTKTNFRYNEKNGLTGELIRFLTLYRNRLPHGRLFKFTGKLGNGFGATFGGVIHANASSALKYDSDYDYLVIENEVSTGIGNESIGAELAYEGTYDLDRSYHSNAYQSEVVAKFTAQGLSVSTGDEDLIFNIGGGAYFGGGGEAYVGVNGSTVKRWVLSEKTKREQLSEFIENVLYRYYTYK